MSHVFLSYSRRDAAFADRLGRALEERGFDVWQDRSDIRGGAAWEASISAALEDAVAVVVVLSPSAIESEHVAKEMALAGEYRRPIIPVEHVPTPRPPERSPATHQISFRLAGLHRIDFARQPFADGLDQLVTAVTGGTSDAGPPRPMPEPPPSLTQRRARWLVPLLAAVAGVAVIAAVTSLLRQPTAPSGGPPAPSGVPPGAAPADVSGEWFAKVVYSWGDAFEERFAFEVDGNALRGTAGYHTYPEEIRDGRVEGDRVTFALQRPVHVNGDERTVTYRYDGTVRGATIDFVMVDDLHRSAVAFIAARSRAAAAEAAGRRRTGGTEPSLLPFSSSGYDAEYVRRRIDGRMDAIRGCFRAAEFDSVDHQYPCYVLRFDEAGQVTEVNTDQGRRSAALDTCMERVLREVDWGRPETGTQALTRLCFAAPILPGK